MQSQPTVSTQMDETRLLPGSRSRGDKVRRWLGGSFAPYLFILPFFLMFVAFGLFPLLYALVLSFTNWRGAGTPQFIGLENYTFLLGNRFFWQSLSNSVLLWLMIVPVQTFLSVLVASLLSRPLAFQSFFRTVYLVPYLVPLVAVAQVWLIMFDRDFGTVNVLLNLLGLPNIGWLTTETWARPTMALLVFWKQFGFSIVLMLAAIQAIPPDIYESAALDGASGAAQFWYITVPLMRRTIAFFMIIATLGVLQMFAEPYVLTQGGPYNATTTAGYALYRYTRTLDLGTGAANSFLLMIIVTAISLAMLKFMRARDEI